MEAHSYFRFPTPEEAGMRVVVTRAFGAGPSALPIASYAFADALLALKDNGLESEAQKLLLRWFDVEIPNEAGIEKGVTMSDNPDQNFTNSAIDILFLPVRLITWPFRKLMAWAYKGVGE